MTDKICFNFETEKWENITVDMVKKWESIFPDVDVVNILLKRMPLWLEANPRKAHKKNWVRFITNWLSREQSRYDDIRLRLTL